MCFHALEEVFDEMALGVGLTVKWLRLLIESLETFAWDRAASAPMGHKLLAEGQAVEAFVTHQMRVTKGLVHLTRGGEVMEVASAQHEVTMQASSSTAASSLVVIHPRDSPMACCSRSDSAPWRPC